MTQWFGEEAANPKACRYPAEGFCGEYRVGDAHFREKIAFWKTPVTVCGDFPWRPLCGLLTLDPGPGRNQGPSRKGTAQARPQHH